MTHTKQANPMQPTDNDTALYAKNIGNNFLAGAAGGLGLGSLYYLSQYLQNKARTATKLPTVQEIADAPLDDEDVGDQTDAPLEVKTSNAVALKDFLLPVAGAGAGALLARARSGEKNKLRNTLLGAGLGGAVGAGANAAVPYVSEEIAKRTPKNYSDFLFGGFGGESPDYDTSVDYAFKSVTPMLAGIAGGAGGLALTKAVMEQNSDHKNRDDVEKSRQEYFDALRGTADPDTKEKQAAENDALLDQAFAAYEKRAGFMDYVYAPSNYLHTLALIGGLGSGAIGFHHMYKRTRAESAAKARARAAAARQRMQGLSAPWVDPKELAQVKSLTAETNPATRGV